MEHVRVADENRSCLRMAQDAKSNVHDIIWHFCVTDPRLHSKGFTVYKVTCRALSVQTPETLNEIVCWKRYNDFKTLYTSLLALHKAHNRTEHFPAFAKPQLFGRFSESVIEKRRESALELLNFISSQPHLYKSRVFRHFLEEGRVQSDFNKRGSLMASRSSNMNIISAGLKVNTHSKLDAVPSCQDASTHRGLGHKERITKSESENKEDPRGAVIDSDTYACRREKLTMLEGTWNFPQEADNISLGSSSDDETADNLMDDDSLLMSSLLSTDLASFEPGSQTSTVTILDESTRSMTKCSNWLQEGLSMCAVMGTETACDHGQGDSETVAIPVAMEFSDKLRKAILNRESAEINASQTSLILENFQAGWTVAGSNCGGTNVDDSAGKELEDSINRMSKSLSSSRTECGKGDVDLSELQIVSSSFVSKSFTGNCGSQNTPEQDDILENVHPGTIFRSISGASSSSVGSEPNADSQKTGRKSSTHKTTRNFLKRLASGNSISQKPRSATEHSVSSMDLGGKEDYIYVAASQISRAQSSEANGDFEVAFAYYKSSVGILLHGVQADTNKCRRDAVRRKTAQYLMKAEDLFNKHLADKNVQDLRWGVDSFLSPSLDLDPSFTFIRGSAKELRSLQVLGVVDRVILVRDKNTDGTYVVKSIAKSTRGTGCTQSILPTSCPYMVSLYKFFETDDSIFLLLQYASGGKLWAYIGDYLSRENSSQANAGVEVSASCRNFYSGLKLEMGNKNEEAWGANSRLKDIAKNENGASYVSAVNVRSEGGLEGHVQSLNSTSSLMFPEKNEESSQSSSARGPDNKSSQNDRVKVKGELVILQDTHGQDMFSDSELTNLHICDHKTTPACRRFSSLSSDCAQVSEQDSSVISPVSLLEEDSFSSVLHKNQAGCDDFSIRSTDSAEVHNSSLSFSERTFNTENTAGCFISHLASSQSGVAGICTFTDEATLPVADENQVKFVSVDGALPQDAAGACAPAFSSDDIIKKSKELLTEVEKVLAEKDDETRQTGSRLHEHSRSLVNSSISYDSTKQSQHDRTSFSEVSNSDLSSKHSRSLAFDNLEGPAGNYWDPSEFVNGRDENAGKSFSNVLDLSGSFTVHTEDAERPVSKIEGARRKHHSHSSTRSCSSSLKQASTPRKLSVNRMSCKDMTRSASFECDLKSPSRNRARTVSGLFEDLDFTSADAVQIPESFIKRWMAQLVTAVSRLHSLGVVCRDLKPDNVLLGDGGQVYLTYFCNLGHGSQDLDWNAKENLYAAPEVGSVNECDRSCDWWSIGALLYELVVGRSLNECHPGGINSHTQLYVPTFVSDETRGLLEGLLRHNPHERLGSGMAGSEEIKSHPFFSGIDWHALEYS